MRAGRLTCNECTWYFIHGLENGGLDFSNRPPHPRPQTCSTRIQSPHHHYFLHVWSLPETERFPQFPSTIVYTRIKCRCFYLLRCSKDTTLLGMYHWNATHFLLSEANALPYYYLGDHTALEYITVHSIVQQSVCSDKERGVVVGPFLHTSPPFWHALAAPCYCCLLFCDAHCYFRFSSFYQCCSYLSLSTQF